MSWSHPDAAWSPWYQAPQGIEGYDEPCFHGHGTRMRVGPTGNRKQIWVLADNCGRCGRILRTLHDLSWKEYDWIRRWNRRCDV